MEIRNNWKDITIVILFIVLISAFTYEGFRRAEDKQELQIQNATLNGYNLARSEIIVITSQCKEYPIKFLQGGDSNGTFSIGTQEYQVTLVALECLREGGK